eukprot:TRINITY_DN16189_c0_g1_i1.p1 TRINITY_DN16189_c0_g1~~TRINITY_DN16189_c0_g1_i1.p1  ORF type:complete len:103 (-),score=13.68 TRINITY_DN16189_c0_g1_i1:455-763(-)
MARSSQSRGYNSFDMTELVMGCLISAFVAGSFVGVARLTGMVTEPPSRCAESGGYHWCELSEDISKIVSFALGGLLSWLSHELVDDDDTDEFFVSSVEACLL